VSQKTKEKKVAGSQEGRGGSKKKKIQLAFTATIPMNDAAIGG